MTSQDGSSKKRLFIGTLLSPEQQQQLGSLNEQFDGRLTETWRRRLKWVRADKLHLTWLFLGQVDEQNVATIADKLQDLVVGQPRMEIDYTKPTFWPNARQPRQFVLVPDAVPPAVKSLAGAIKLNMLQYIQRPESRPYRPHITVLRLEPSSASAAVPDWFPLNSMLPLKQTISSVSLIQSHLGTKDSYEALHTFELKG